MQGFSSWLQSLLPYRRRPSETVLLDRRRIYILPTRAGLVYGVMLLILFLCAINYSLSLGFGLTFLLAGCGLVGIYLTYRNLVQLSLATGHPQAVFAGETAHVPLHIHNQRSYPRYALHISFLNGKTPGIDQLADVGGSSSASMHLGIPTSRRGWQQLPRLRIHSQFPLGLLRAWSDWQPAARLLVYPQPEAGEPPFPVYSGGRQTGHGLAGHDDFAGIRAYQSGDSLRHMAWRQIARKPEGTFVTKQFEGGASGHWLFDYASLPDNLDTEQKLARMTRWLLMAEAQSQPYAFALGTTRFEAANGPVHLHACLQALATFGLSA
ncbi:DUF58 domain-containing protein [uncultured Oxalicibacterium sp.]|uniref:DUF58 domain-containing protein n=1 Tax=uncultured Oxalicibacterium sp. TaxID=1168540 RepID=UPI0025E4C6A8|nr:DUF58 domain-containing protein [uncultured Oxalicibacterium sp.]